MPIANYTTEVPAIKTVYEIQKMLTEHGAKSIIINYENSEPISLAFLIATPTGDIPFRLPANIERISAVLIKQRNSSTRTHRYNPNQAQIDHDKALKVGWRILRDWVRAQLAIIDTEMVVMEQVFLPYMIGKDNKTIFQIISDNKYLMLNERNT